MSWQEAEQRLDFTGGLAEVYNHGDGRPVYMLTTLKALRHLFQLMKDSVDIRDEIRMVIESDFPDTATIQITDEAVRIL